MHDVMAGYVERGEVPCLVTLVSRRGEVHLDAIGVKVVGGGPIRRDTIFRISSMTKPITAAATMILVEECKLRLDEPVDRLLPELSRRKVLKRLDGPLDTVRYQYYGGMKNYPKAFRVRFSISSGGTSSWCVPIHQ